MYRWCTQFDFYARMTKQIMCCEKAKASQSCNKRKKKKHRLQREAFPGGHPSNSSPRPTEFDFGDRRSPLTFPLL